MMIAGVFEIPASVLAFFYSLTTNYAVAIAIMAVLVMLLVTPLNLKSTKGMLEMQRLAPEMRRLQTQYKGDRTKLNEEMMKL
jgi:YidC/Oxa1 family membrane protein insertase